MSLSYTILARASAAMLLRRSTSSSPVTLNGEHEFLHIVGVYERYCPCAAATLITEVASFGKRRLEQLHPFLVSEQFGVGSGTPVTSHFVMFDTLGFSSSARIPASA